MTGNPELLSEYARDSSRRGPPPEESYSGSAGGSACGDLVRVSLRVEDGEITRASFDSEGCAALAACAAAVSEEVEAAPVLAAALVSAGDIAQMVGGLGPQGRHAADLVADALARALSHLASCGGHVSSAPDDRDRVLVAVSGGVDSAVAALTEREQGRDVVAVTLKLWADERTDGTQACCSPEAVRGARSLCHSMGIPHFTLDLESAFRRDVVGAFVDGYKAGETPNPCVICNGDLRIDAMVELADRVGASHLVTGHYARLADDGSGPLLSEAADPAKDQSYMLSGLRPGTLARLRFPLGESTKSDVREQAQRAGLSVASKRESQDLCFLAGEGKRSFLARHGGLKDRAGDVVDASGDILGEHPGHHHFTVGQRRGLGVATGEPLYVLATDAKENRVEVGKRDQLARTTVRLRAARLHRDSGRADRVKLRYHSKAIECRVSVAGPGEHAELEVHLAEPAFGVAPGQTACLYDGELVVGRATIAGAS